VGGGEGAEWGEERGAEWGTGKGQGERRTTMGLFKTG